MPDTFDLSLNIYRHDPDTNRSWYQKYQVKAGPIMRFVDILRSINDEQDPTLTWNSSCEHGQCGTCSMKINNKPMLACELLVENAVTYFNTTTFTIEPLEVAPVVRDLAIDTDVAYERVNRVKPYVIEPPTIAEDGEEHPINPRSDGTLCRCYQVHQLLLLFLSLYIESSKFFGTKCDACSHCALSRPP